MKHISARVLENKRVAADFYKMRLESPYLAKNAKPGQFIEVRCMDGTEPLLRRPLGCHRILKNGVELLYEIVGKGTAILSKKVKGDTLDIIGPLGEGFSLPKLNAQYPIRNTLLIAGGIGVAPMPALAEALRRQKIKVTVILGAKKSAHILCDNEFKSLGCSVKIATEDGSKGYKGLVTDILERTLADEKEQPGAIYACGPNGMLEAIWLIAKEKTISCQFSFESRMACGTGVCLGCPIKVRKELIDFEYRMVCKDGPVFYGDEIAWGI